MYSAIAIIKKHINQTMKDRKDSDKKMMRERECDESVVVERVYPFGGIYTPFFSPPHFGMSYRSLESKE